MKKKIIALILIAFISFGLVGCDISSMIGGGEIQVTIDLDEVYLNVQSQIPNKDAITDNMTLPTKFGTVNITWTSDNPNIISNNGIVIRPDVDTNVTLNCTLDSGSEKKTYKIEVTVKAKEVIVTIPELSIEEVLAGTVGEHYKTKGVVVATSALGFLLKDETSYIYAYLDTAYAKDLNIGDEVEVEGATSSYGGRVQFNKPTYNKVGTVDVVQPEPRLLDKEAYEALNTDAVKIEYIKIEGKLVISGNYTNLEVEGSSLAGSIVRPLVDVSGLNGKKVSITGYFVYCITSSANVRYMYFLATDIIELEDQGDQPGPGPDQPTELSTIEEVLAGTVGEKYKAKGAVVATASTSVLIKDETGYIYVYFDSTYPKDLKVGDEVEVEGATSSYGGRVQFNKPTYNKVGTVDVVQPEPRLLDKEAYEALNTDAVKIEYIKIEGKLVISGNYTNLEVEGSSLAGSIVRPLVDVSGLNGKKVSITGYFVYCITSSANVRYMYFLATDIIEVIETDSHEIAHLPEELHGVYTGDGVRVEIAESSVKVTDPTGKTLEYVLYVEDGNYYIEEEGNKVFCTFGDGTVTNEKGTFTKEQNTQPTFTSIADVRSGSANTSYNVKAVVVATGATGVVLQDETGLILTYDKNYAKDLVVGDEVELTGTLGEHNGCLQLNTPTYTKVGTKDVTYPEPAILTAAEMESLASASAPVMQYVKLEGVLKLSGSYINLEVEGTNVKGSLTTSLDVSALANKSVVVSGYYLYVSGTSVKYVNIICTAIEESDKPVPVLETSTIQEVLAGEAEKTYKVRATVVAAASGVYVVQDETGLITINLSSSVDGACEVGDVVVVEGALKQYNNCLQFNYPQIDVVDKADVQYPEPVVLDKDAYEALDTEVANIQYVKFEATLNISSNNQYFNLAFEGSNLVGSLAKPIGDYSPFNGKKIAIEGYYIYTVTSGTNKYMYFAAVNVEEVTEVTPPTPLEVSTIAAVLSGNQTEEYKVKTAVIATANTSFLLQDETGLLLVYAGDSYAKDLAIGDEVELIGMLDNHNGCLQLTGPEYEKVGIKDVTYPEARLLSVDDLAALVAAETPVMEFVKVNGQIAISGKYVNLVVDSETIKCSLSTDIDVTELNGKDVTVEGYYLYISTSGSTKFVNIICTAIEEVEDTSNDEEKLAEIVASLSAMDGMETVTGFELKTEINGFSIVWTSSNAELISSEGKVLYLPEEDTAVEFAAVISKGELSETINISLIAKAASTCADLQALSEEDLANFTNYAVKVVVVFVGEEGFLGKDDTGYIFFYKGSDYAKDLEVGDEVIIKGFLSWHGDHVQFANFANYEKTDNSVTVEAPECEELDAFGLDDIMNNNEIRPLTFKGVLKVSGQYINVEVDGATVAGSLLSDGKDYSSLDGKTVIVKGYYLYITGENRYAYFAADSVEEYVPDINAEFNAVVAEIRSCDGMKTAAGFYYVSDYESVTVTFESTNEDLIDSEGRPGVLPEEDTPVKFIFTVTCGELSETVEITIVAKAASSAQELNALTKEEMESSSYAAKLVVVYPYDYGFLGKDESDYFLVYKGYDYDKSFNVGDVVVVRGLINQYGGHNQFSETCFCEKLEETEEVATPEFTLINAQGLNEILGTPIRPLMVKGLLTMNGTYTNIIVDGANYTVSTVATDADYSELNGLYVVLKGYYLYNSGTNSEYASFATLSIEKDPDVAQGSVSPYEALSFVIKPCHANEDGSWEVTFVASINEAIVNPTIEVKDLVIFGFLNGVFGDENYLEETALLSDLSNLETILEDGTFTVTLTVAKELVEKYASTYYIDANHKGGIAIDAYLEVKEDGLDISVPDNYYAGIYFFNSYLDIVETTGEGTSESPLTVTDALAVAAYLPAGIYSYEYFYVEGEIADEVTLDYANFNLKAGEDLLLVYGLSTADGNYKYGTAFNKVQGLPIAIGDIVVLEAQAYHYVDKDGVETLELKDARLVTVNGEEVTYELVEENTAEANHEGTADDPLDAADAILLASKLDPESKEISEGFYYIEATIASDPTAEYCNFNFSDGEKTILVYGLWNAEKTGRYGTKRDFPELPVKNGDTVVLYGQLQNYTGKFEIINASLLKVVEGE